MFVAQPWTVLQVTLQCEDSVVAPLGHHGFHTQRISSSWMVALVDTEAVTLQPFLVSTLDSEQL